MCDYIIKPKAIWICLHEWTHKLDVHLDLHIILYNFRISPFLTVAKTLRTLFGVTFQSV